MVPLLRSRQLLLGLTVTSLFIGFFLYRVNVREITDALGEANYLYVFPGLWFYGLALIWRSFRWKVILRPLGDIGVYRIWPVLVVGYAANNLLPARLGELVRSYWLQIREDISKTSALATIVVERVFDGITLLLLAAFASYFVPVIGLFRELGVQANVDWLVIGATLSLPFLFVGAVIVCVLLFPSKVVALVARLANILPGRLSLRAGGLARRFVLGLGSLRSFRQTGQIFMLSVLIWGSEAALYYFIALGFGMNDILVSTRGMIGVILLTTAVSNLGLVVPASAGGIGPFEFLVQSTLMFFGIASGVASGYAIVVHLALLLPVTVMGMFYIWTEGLSLAVLARSSIVPESRFCDRVELGSSLRDEL